MSPPQLTRIELPNGRVGVTACPQSQLAGFLPSVASLPAAREVLRIIPLGDRRWHPISWLWSRQPRLAACLPDSFACVLIEMKQFPAEFDVARLRSLIHNLGSQIELLQESRHIELPKFLPALAPRHLQADESLKQAVSTAGAAPDRTVSLAVQAGLYLMNDCLDESHACSQSIEGEGTHRCGDYWHAITHRREPDYGNAKYWFRQVGRHPIFERLPDIARRIAAERKAESIARFVDADWDPFLFVDLCERHARDESSPSAVALREIQGWEMALLLEQSVQ